MAGEDKKHRIGRLHDLEPSPIERERQAVGELLTREVGHDLANALMGVAACAKSALDKLEPSSAAHPYVYELKLAASRAAQLLQEQSAFRRTADEVALEVDANECIRSRQTLLTTALGPAFELVLRLAPELPPTRAKRQQLELTLFAMLRAVREVIRAGQVVLETSALDGSNGSARARIAFVLEEKGEPSVAGLLGERIGGPDAALPRIASALGARLTLESIDGGRVRLQLDLAPVDATPSTVDHDAALAVGKRPVVLLVDDDELVRLAMRAFLEREAFTVLEAANAEEALRVARAANPAIDLLITDLSLPGQRGLELFRALQVVSAGLPVLFISGYSAPEAIAAGMLEPGRPLISKPIDGQELAKSVRALLSGPAQG